MPPNTHTLWLTTTCNSSSLSSGIPGLLHIHDVHMYTWSHMHKHKMTFSKAISSKTNTRRMSVKFDNRRKVLEGKMASPWLTAHSPRITKQTPSGVPQCSGTRLLSVANHGERQKFRRAIEALRPLNTALSTTMCLCLTTVHSGHTWNPSIWETGERQGD